MTITHLSKMKHCFITLLSVSLLVLVLVSCGNIKSNANFIVADTVSFKTKALHDAVSYKLSNGKQCAVKTSTLITYPSAYKDSTSTKNLVALFSSSILDINIDSTSIDGAFQQYLKNILGQFGSNTTSDIEDCATETCEDNDFTSDFSEYCYDIKITPMYNSKNIISFCKEEITKRDGKTTMTSRYYFNFDLASISRLDLNNIFSEEDISQITQLLKEQLMAQLKFTNEDDLYEAGYFNLDNLVANNNFLISNEGISWYYLPYEIACFSIGETKIMLPYSTISQYINDNCILSQFKTNN